MFPGHCVFLLWPEAWENKRLDQVTFWLSVTCNVLTFLWKIVVMFFRGYFISVNCVLVNNYFRCNHFAASVPSTVYDSSGSPYDHIVIMCFNEPRSCSDPKCLFWFLELKNKTSSCMCLRKTFILNHWHVVRRKNRSEKKSWEEKCLLTSS